MKKIIAAFLLSATIFNFCSCSGENPGSAEDDAAETFSDTELDEMEAVDKAIQELLQSEDFNKLDIPQQAECMLILLNDIAENGAGDFTYPLIKKRSIYYGGNGMISFEYSCGILGGVDLRY